MHKKDIKDFTLDELKKLMPGFCQPEYRAEQIFFWLYRMHAVDFNRMSNIPAIFREELAGAYYIGSLHLAEHLRSSDGTEKFLFRLSDGDFVETVLIRSGSRKTVCISSQAGCKFACSFCASGSKGFRRNLTPSEITAQILFLQDKFKHKIDNYVFMGMGEPLDNFDNVKRALLIMKDSKGMTIGVRRITISTCGITPAIKRLTQLGLPVNLSVSLHASNDKLRDMLIPVNKRYPLGPLIKACKDFVNRTGRIITLEYVLIKGKNHSLRDASQLAGIAKLLKAKVNLIPYSRIFGKEFCPPDKKDIEIFMRRLKEKSVKVTLRKSKGEDIQAACGQLAGRRNG